MKVIENLDNMYNLKINTSFVSPLTLPKFIDSNILPIFIIRSIWNSDLIGKYEDTKLHFKELSPSTELFRSWRDSKIDFSEYSKKYVIELSKLDFKKEIEKMKYLADLCKTDRIVLLGYGSNNKTCHRSVLADVLNKSGLLQDKITELIL